MKEETKNAIMIAITVILILGVVYVTTAVFMTGEIGNKANNTKSKTTTRVTTSKYKNMIIASNTFKQQRDKYMVIFFSEKDTDDDFKKALSTYDSSNKEIKLYKVNLDEVINSYVKNAKENKNPTNSNDLSINGTTLITINNQATISYINEIPLILDALK